MADGNIPLTDTAHQVTKDDKVVPIGAPVGAVHPEISRGKSDPAGDVVDRIHISTDRFMIYAVVDSVDARVRHVIKEPYEEARKTRENLSPIVGTMATIADVVIGLRDTRDSEWKALYERWMVIQACAISLAFEGQRAAAETLLSDFRGQVELRRDSRNRMYYIIANVVALIVILGLWAAAGRFGLPPFLAWIAEPITVGNGAVKPIDVLALGALGAFFSVSAGVNQVNVNRSITMREMLYTGFVRIPIGVLAAAVAIFLIQGKWVLGMVEAPALLWTVYLLGFLAGFSEFFVPNALKQVEASAAAKAPGSR